MTKGVIGGSIPPIGINKYNPYNIENYRKEYV